MQLSYPPNRFVSARTYRRGPTEPNGQGLAPAAHAARVSRKRNDQWDVVGEVDRVLWEGSGTEGCAPIRSS
jgi:hypothetical protein